MFICPNVFANRLNFLVDHQWSMDKHNTVLDDLVKMRYDFRFNERVTAMRSIRKDKRHIGQRCKTNVESFTLLADWSRKARLMHFF